MLRVADWVFLGVKYAYISPEKRKLVMNCSTCDCYGEIDLAEAYQRKVITNEDIETCLCGATE